MRSTTHEVQPLLPLESVKLGRLVTSIRQPHQNYMDPVCDIDIIPLITPQLYLDQSNIQETGSKASINTNALADFAKVRTSASAQGLSTPIATIYQLPNSDTWFNQARQDEGTRRWMEQSLLSYSKIYLIVGYKTVRDSNLEQAEGKERYTSASVTLPVSEALAAATVVPVLPNVIDPGVGGIKASKTSSRQVLSAPGEQVAEIQVRRLKFSFVSSRNLDKAKLDPVSYWESKMSFRGQTSGVDDIIGVKLEETDDSDSEDSDDEL